MHAVTCCNMRQCLYPSGVLDNIAYTAVEYVVRSHVDAEVCYLGCNKMMAVLSTEKLVNESSSLLLLLQSDSKPSSRCVDGDAQTPTRYAVLQCEMQ